MPILETCSFLADELIYERWRATFMQGDNHSLAACFGFACRAGSAIVCVWIVCLSNIF
jgi:hypothetical protein